MKKILVLQKIEWVVFLLLILFLPTQLGKHFWPGFSFIDGIRVDYLSPTVYVTDLLILTLFGCWLVRSIWGKQKDNRFFTNLFTKWKFGAAAYLLFLFLLAGNITFSGSMFGWYYLGKFLEFSFLAFYIATTVSDKAKVLQIMFLWSCSLLFESFLAIAQYLNQGAIGGPFYFLGERAFTSQTPGIANASINGELVLRPYATFSHPNVLAGYVLVSLILVAFFLPLQTVGWKKLVSATALVLGSICLLLTLSRVAIILWLVLFGISLFRNAGRILHSKKWQLGVVSVLAAVFCTIALFTPVSARLWHTTVYEEAVVQREVLASAAWQMIWSHPLLGVGWGNFLTVLAVIQTPVSLSQYLQPVHNIFLLLGAETGVSGLFFFLWFLYRTFRRISSVPYLYPFGVALVIMLLLGLFDHYFFTLQQGQLLAASIAGFCWSFPPPVSNGAPDMGKRKRRN